MFSWPSHVHKENFRQTFIFAVERHGEQWNKGDRNVGGAFSTIM